VAETGVSRTGRVALRCSVVAGALGLAGDGEATKGAGTSTAGLAAAGAGTSTAGLAAAGAGTATAGLATSGAGSVGGAGGLLAAGAGLAIGARAAFRSSPVLRTLIHTANPSTIAHPAPTTTRRS
jgi:hypothetical protein